MMLLWLSGPPLGRESIVVLKLVEMDLPKDHLGRMIALVLGGTLILRLLAGTVESLRTGRLGSSLSITSSLVAMGWVVGLVLSTGFSGS